MAPDPPGTAIRCALLKGFEEVPELPITYGCLQNGPSDQGYLHQEMDSGFVADKLASLLMSRQQVVDARERRKKKCAVRALPRTTRKQSLGALFKKYKVCHSLYAESQCTKLNCIEKIPSLNYQKWGNHLQDGVLWDPLKQDLHKCPVCSNCCTMTVDNLLTVSTYNWGDTTPQLPDGKMVSFHQVPKSWLILFHAFVQRTI
jgi:hypothetical protein